MSIEFFVKGTPVPWQRVARDPVSRRAFVPARTRDWKDVVAYTARQCYRKDPLLEPLALELHFYLRTPKCVRKVYDQDKTLPCHGNRPDSDNLCKAVKDALNGIIYKDDCQIWDLRVMKFYAYPGEEGVAIIVKTEQQGDPNA